MDAAPIDSCPGQEPGPIVYFPVLKSTTPALPQHLSLSYDGAMVQRIAWFVLAAIHVAPALALFRPSLLVKLYGVVPDSETFLLLHHRAALFLAIFIACLWAVFDPNVRRVAAVTVGISMLSFLWLYWSAGSPAGLRSIAIADAAGLPFLALCLFRAFTLK